MRRADEDGMRNPGIDERLVCHKNNSAHICEQTLKVHYRIRREEVSAMLIEEERGLDIR